jgi:hypothetical protein
MQPSQARARPEPAPGGFDERLVASAWQHQRAILQGGSQMRRERAALAGRRQAPARIPDSACSSGRPAS